MIRFACPGCNATYTVDDAKGGKAGKCPKCSAQFVIPPAGEGGPPPAPEPRREPAPPPPPPAADNGAVEIKPCPKCGARLSVAASDLGVDVECPYCQAVYPAKRSGGPAADRPSRREQLPSEEERERPSRRKRDEDDEGDRPSRRRAATEDEDDRPRRRRRDEDDEDDDRPRRRRSGRRSREEAEAAVGGPGIALIVIGVLGFLYALVNVVVILSGNGANPFGGGNQPMQPAQQVGQYIGMFLTFVWSAVVTLGGFKLKTLGGRAPAMSGAIFAMLPCNPCCLAGIPIGIWAITTLNRPDVQRAMD